jgi:hypothetical protein
MTTHRSRRLLPAWLLVAGYVTGWSPPASSAVCDFRVKVAVDATRADTSVVAYFCRGYGQVFLAADTLIQSISIWRPAERALDGAPRHLFITETGTDPGYPLVYPDVRRVLLDAGLVVNSVGDGIHPVEYRWVFNPPFALPHRGKFFLAVLASEGSVWLLSAVTTDPYPDGEAWELSPDILCAPGPPFGDTPPHLDLVFEVQFCATGATLARPGSWGRLKVIYR